MSTMLEKIPTKARRTSLEVKKEKASNAALKMAFSMIQDAGFIDVIGYDNVKDYIAKNVAPKGKFPEMGKMLAEVGLDLHGFQQECDRHYRVLMGQTWYPVALRRRKEILAEHSEKHGPRIILALGNQTTYSLYGFEWDGSNFIQKETRFLAFTDEEAIAIAEDMTHPDPRMPRELSCPRRVGIKVIGTIDGTDDELSAMVTSLMGDNNRDKSKYIDINTLEV